MNQISFTHNGIKYQVKKITELETISGKRRILITTKDNKIFEISYVDSLFRWVITEEHERGVSHKRRRKHSKN